MAAEACFRPEANEYAAAALAADSVVALVVEDKVCFLNGCPEEKDTVCKMLLIYIRLYIVFPNCCFLNTRAATICIMLIPIPRATVRPGEAILGVKPGPGLFRFLKT